MPTVHRDLLSRSKSEGMPFGTSYRCQNRHCNATTWSSQGISSLIDIFMSYYILVALSVLCVATG